MNTPKDFSNVVIELPPLQARKLELIQDAIGTPATYEALISNLLDTELARALILLLEEERISPELCEEYASLLPDYLRGTLHF